MLLYVTAAGLFVVAGWLLYAAAANLWQFALNGLTMPGLTVLALDALSFLYGATLAYLTGRGLSLYWTEVAARQECAG